MLIYWTFHFESVAKCARIMFNKPLGPGMMVHMGFVFDVAIAYIKIQIYNNQYIK